MVAKDQVKNITPRSVWHDPVHFIAFGFGSGASPLAPGTMGTLAAVPLVVVLSLLPGWVYVLAMLLVFVLGVYVSHVTSHDLKVHDHGGIVIDEIAGFMLTMWLIPMTWVNLLLGFVLFRIFDIVKPFPIRWLDKKVAGGFGIMVDDVLAGLYAWAVLWVYVYV